MSHVRDHMSLARARARYDITTRVRGSNVVIGGGSFADVFLGHMEGQEVAIKALRGIPAERHKLETRLVRELLVWSTLNHRNVNRLLGIAYIRGTFPAPLPSLVSPCLPDSLMTYANRHPHEKKRLVEETTQGLNYLHYKYVIHGDLKPENVRVSHSGTVKIIDFGISKIRDVTGFTTNLQRNPRYTPPELLPIDTRVTETRPTFKTDIFSFAMLALQTLQGSERYPNNVPSDPTPYNHLPYQGYDYRLLDLIHRGDRPRRESYPRVSSGQWRMITMCWRHEPNHRPTISFILANIHEWL